MVFNCIKNVSMGLKFKESSNKRVYGLNNIAIIGFGFASISYGLANTLMQTVNLKPSVKNKHLDNLFYTGQLTVPGPGVPSSIISGMGAEQQMINYLNKLS